MKEIRTIKMVEVTDIKFVADDGREFVGENAERDCRDYERTNDRKKVEKAFERVNMVKLNMPFVDWFCDGKFYRVQLNSKSDFIAMMDYFNVVWDVYDNDIKEPAVYPYTMTVSCSCEYVNEYKRDIKEELKQVMKQLDGGFIAREKRGLYDELCRVLTDWEGQDAVDDDLYNMLVKIQNNWETIITAAN